MPYKEFYSLKEQQEIADDVMNACDEKPLKRYVLKQRSITRYLNNLIQDTSDRASIRYGLYTITYNESHVEEERVAAIFGLDERQHLMTGREFATSLFNELASITKMVYTLEKNQTKEEIRHMS